LAELVLYAIERTEEFGGTVTETWLASWSAGVDVRRRLRAPPATTLDCTIWDSVSRLTSVRFRLLALEEDEEESVLIGVTRTFAVDVYALAAT
jgi:hypothetical protein